MDGTRDLTTKEVDHLRAGIRGWAQRTGGTVKSLPDLTGVPMAWIHKLLYRRGTYQALPEPLMKALAETIGLVPLAESADESIALLDAIVGAPPMRGNPLRDRLLERLDPKEAPGARRVAVLAVLPALRVSDPSVVDVLLGRTGAFATLARHAEVNAYDRAVFSRGLALGYALGTLDARLEVRPSVGMKDGHKASKKGKK